MENNKKRYLDKVVDFLVEDTKVDYEHRMIFFPFTYKRSLRQGTNNLTPFHKLLFDSYIPIDGFMEYIKELYDITSIEDITHVWETYKVIMYKIVFGDNSSPLYFNESVDRISREDYLNKVVEYLVDDTIIDFNENKFQYPFSPFTYSLSLFPSHYSSFLNYNKDNYGLTKFETYSVWQEYKNIIIDKINNSGSINESIDRRDEYLNKIVDYLVDDTMVDQKNKVWYPPFPTDHDNPTFNHFYGLIPMTDHLELKFLVGNSYVRNFFNYCKDTYGLTDDVEISKVWKRYLKVLTPKINGFSIINGIPTINESVGRKDDYLNKIVNFLIDDTEYRIYTNRFSDHSETKVDIWFPSTNTDEDGYSYSIYDIYNWLNGTSWVLSGGDDIDTVCSTYGICDIDIIQELYNRYIQKLSTIIYEEMLLKNGEFINESVDRRDEYLNKIVDFLVDDTEMVYDIKVIRYPHLPNHPQFFSFSRFFLFNSHPSFSKYIKDNYSLNDEEIDYVWEEYKNIINEKTKP